LFFTLGNELDHIEHGFNNGTFEVVTTLITENSREEPEHRHMFCREFEAKGPNGIHDNNLELIADLSHKTSDLFNESIDGGFITGLYQRN